MKISNLFKYFTAATVGFALLFPLNSTVIAQRGKSVQVTLQTGIYRDGDKSWMTTAPEDVIVTVFINKKTFTANPATDKGFVTLENVPCGAPAKINIRFVGTGSYSLTSRSYTKNIPCGKATVNLGKLEYGKW